jgi:hypothetical protein
VERSFSRVKPTEKLFAGGPRTRVSIFGKVKGDGRFRSVGTPFEDLSPDIGGNDAQDDVRVDRGGGKKGVIVDEPIHVRIADVAVSLSPRHQVETDLLSGADTRGDQPLVGKKMRDLPRMARVTTNLGSSLQPEHEGTETLRRQRPPQARADHWVDADLLVPGGKTQ